MTNPESCLMPISQLTQTSLRRLQDVLKRSRDLTTKPDVVKSSYRRRLIYCVLKASDFRCLKDVRFTTFWRRSIYDVLKTSDLRCLEEVRFTTSWRRLINAQLAHDVVATLGFGYILVATSDNVVTTLSQRCASDVITTTKN